MVQPFVKHAGGSRVLFTGQQQAFTMHTKVDRLRNVVAALMLILRFSTLFGAASAIATLFGAVSAVAQPAVEQSSHELVVGTRVAPPFSMKGRDGAWEGISIDLWRHVAERLHLRYRLEGRGRGKERGGWGGSGQGGG